MKCPDWPLKGDLNSDLIIQTYKIQVITPIVGGGVEPGKNDFITPIRPSSIRGHLRFWWRATKGINYKKVSELRQRENEVWGSPDNPSPVTIDVEKLIVGVPQKRSPPDYGFPERFGPEAYALFSAKENDSDIIREGYSFRLIVRWLKHDKLQRMREKENEELLRLNKPIKARYIHDIGPDVIEALRAWVNYGGIGGRTRRGCGALFNEELAFKSIEDFSGYSFRIFHKSGLKDPLDAWSQAVKVVQDFRQSFRGPRHEKKIRTKKGVMTITAFGRSYWPEPDSIRKITGCALKPPNINNFDHSVPQTPTTFFPRAELGLPIIFHFSDGPGKKTAMFDLDPPDTMLIPIAPSGTNGTRMASPVITRPIKLATGENISMIIALKLLDIPPLRLVEIGSNVVYDITQDAIRNIALASYINSPLGPSKFRTVARSSDGSALEGFINFAKYERHFKEAI
ncbi:type III-B CRISPR module RAMP protein Cmr1 [Candidatus Methanocrinis natronophilus]|uniref:Type III-B CRISPR module RAMP protein Cmr1 n=1 Tax=Candidatus Methanocrinis natronophilus TaxID=3033396 RepID=A0ABT5X4P3_9EURY|nr:type III-B CRISPR module RAMP protein Cmr1 [Candidatus Methanocrinis natronophilus]MDF0589656.1 type III-B CRISPR module RAMP protein Cmr1 [Candidatus Methanocrinis natronophilus]